MSKSTSFFAFFLFLALCTFTTAVPQVGTSSITVSAGAASPCSSSYYAPSITDTPGQSFYLQVRASSPLYDSHNIQLLPNISAALAVIDASSPVLSVSLVNGSLHSETSSAVNTPLALGSLGGLRNITIHPAFSVQSFIFRNSSTSASASFSQSLGG